MDEKLILEIQSTLKSLIEGGDNNQGSLIWELNMYVDNFLQTFSQCKTLKTVLEELGVTVTLCCNNSIELAHQSDFYSFDDYTQKVFRESIGTFSLHYNIFKNCIDEILQVHYNTDLNIREFVYAISIGYHILYYNYDATPTEFLSHKIRYNDMLFSTPQEHIIYCVALMFMYPLSYVMENSTSICKKSIDNYHYLPPLSIYNEVCPNRHVLEQLTFMDFRLRDVEHLMFWLSQNRPEEFKDLKEKYALLFINY